MLVALVVLFIGIAANVSDVPKINLLAVVAIGNNYECSHTLFCFR